MFLFDLEKQQLPEATSYLQPNSDVFKKEKKKKKTKKKKIKLVKK